jgi:hypothetical protein
MSLRNQPQTPIVLEPLSGSHLELLYGILPQTLAADQLIRKQATDQLTELEKRPGFCSLLLVSIPNLAEIFLNIFASLKHWIFFFGRNKELNSYSKIIVRELSNFFRDDFQKS